MTEVLQFSNNQLPKSSLNTVVGIAISGPAASAITVNQQSVLSVWPIL